MVDPVIRPANGLLLVTLQTGEGSPAAPSVLTDIVPCELDSVSYNAPYKTSSSAEVTGTFAAGAPVVIGQAGTFSFKSRIKGAGVGAVYSPTVKPPLHAPLSASGFMGQFTAAVAAAALTAGTTSSATLANAAAATAEAYRGIPLILTAAPAQGRMPLITDYTAGRVAMLADLYGSALSAANTGAIPANWTYAPTSPLDTPSRASMQPCATIQWWEDGGYHTWTDCRGTVDFDGSSGQPGFATFSFTGIYQGRTDAQMPTGLVYAGQSAPLLVQGSGAQPAFQINRRGLAISKWSLKSNSTASSPDDPNTTFGFGAGQIADRMYQLEVDPLLTLVATRNSLADIAAFTQYPGAIQFGASAGNRASITLPILQPTDTAPALRDKLRSETLHLQAINPGRDAANRDGDVIVCFS